MSGALRLAQIQQILARTDTSLAQKADLLIRAALAAGETDNQTLILWSHLSPDDHHIVSSLTTTSSPVSAEDQERAPGQDPQLLPPSPSEHKFTNVPQGSTNRVSNSGQHHLIRQLITARNGSWLLLITIVATGAVAFGMSDPGLVRTLEMFKSIPKQLEKLLPKISPRELPRVLPNRFLKESTKEIHAGISR